MVWRLQTRPRWPRRPMMSRLCRAPPPTTPSLARIRSPRRPCSKAVGALLLLPPLPRGPLTKCWPDSTSRCAAVPWRTARNTPRTCLPRAARAVTLRRRPSAPSTPAWTAAVMMWTRCSCSRTFTSTLPRCQPMVLLTQPWSTVSCRLWRRRLLDHCPRQLVLCCAAPWLPAWGSLCIWWARWWARRLWTCCTRCRAGPPSRMPSLTTAATTTLQRPTMCPRATLRPAPLPLLPLRAMRLLPRRRLPWRAAKRRRGQKPRASRRSRRRMLPLPRLPLQLPPLPLPRVRKRRRTMITTARLRALLPLPLLRRRMLPREQADRTLRAPPPMPLRPRLPHPTPSEFSLSLLS
eukprot:m.224155 g.224155  ORF g.224155 m.224155 type:complete len:349 (-) comp16412_c0_seq1:78-1124(-)